MSERKRWRRVPGWPGYKVSSAGEVRSVPRILPDGRPHGGWWLTPTPDKDGYLTVLLCDGPRQRRAAVHVLVLEAYVGPCPPGHEGLHGPGGHQVNDLASLRWGTRRENERDKRKGREEREEGDGIGVVSRPFSPVSGVAGGLRR